MPKKKAEDPLEKYGEMSKKEAEEAYKELSAQLPCPDPLVHRALQIVKSKL